MMAPLSGTSERLTLFFCCSRGSPEEITSSLHGNSMFPITLLSWCSGLRYSWEHSLLLTHVSQPPVYGNNLLVTVQVGRVSVWVIPMHPVSRCPPWSRFTHESEGFDIASQRTSFQVIGQTVDSLLGYILVNIQCRKVCLWNHFYCSILDYWSIKIYILKCVGRTGAG